jgi:Uma2 family endonuclease
MRTRLHLTPADHGRPLSYEEFATARGQEGFKYELIEGRLDVSPAPGWPHEALRKWLERQLDEYAAGRPDVISHVIAPGRVFLPESPEGVTAPEPDIACYAEVTTPAGRFSELDWRDWSPLIVVEVLSADTADKDLVRNRRLYARVSSIREYWVIDTRESFDRPSLIAYRRRWSRWAPRVEVPAGGSYATPLLPGFTLRLDPNAR